jgi:hypothetical protein
MPNGQSGKVRSWLRQYRAKDLPVSRNIPGYLFIFSLLLMAHSVLALEGYPGGSQKAAEIVEEQVTADSKPEEKKDRLGGYKILPIPIFITEPAIGEGLGVAIALFHPVKGESGSAPRVTTPMSISQIESERQAPPIVSGVFGAYTNTETWVAGVGHMNNWREDHIRYAGVLAGAKINSSFYVLGLPLKFSLDGLVIFQDIKFRIKDSPVFLGMSLSYLDAKNSFTLDMSEDPPAPLLDSDISDVGLAVTGSYDSRDNTMNPNKGQLVDLSLWRYDEAVGGNYNYWLAKFKALSFRTFHHKFTLGLRLDVSTVDGRPPFYGYPWVKLRGIPAMRYQNKSAGAIEVEGRYLLAPKWEVLGFAGRGFTSGDIPFFENPGNIHSFGVGARFKVIEAQNVWIGMDLAKGNEDWNWYIQVGHPW